jgi:hypothetical protein
MTKILNLLTKITMKNKITTIIAGIFLTVTLALGLIGLSGNGMTSAFANLSCPANSQLIKNECVVVSVPNNNPCPNGGLVSGNQCVATASNLVKTANCAVDSSDIGDGFCADLNNDDELLATPGIACGTYTISKEKLMTILGLAEFREWGNTPVAANYPTVTIGLTTHQFKGEVRCIGQFGYNASGNFLPVGYPGSDADAWYSSQDLGAGGRSKKATKSLIVAKLSSNPVNNYAATSVCLPGFNLETNNTCTQKIASNGYIVDVNSIGKLSCDGITVVQNSKFSCTAPLTGAANNTYFAPQNGIKISMEYGFESICFIQGTNIICPNVVANPGNTEKFTVPTTGNDLPIFVKTENSWVKKGVANVTKVVENTAGNTTSNTAITTLDTLAIKTPNPSETGFLNTSDIQTNQTTVVNSNTTSTSVTAVNGNKINIVCNNGKDILVNSKTVCTFTKPSGKTLPNDLKLAIGNGDIASSSCSANGDIVTCINVSTGSATGTQSLFVQIGDGKKVNTNFQFNITDINNATAAGDSLVRSGSAMAGLTVGTTLLATAGFLVIRHNMKNKVKMNI